MPYLLTLELLLGWEVEVAHWWSVVHLPLQLVPWLCLGAGQLPDPPLVDEMMR